MVQEKYNNLNDKQEFKFLIPMYVPIKKLEKFLSMPKGKLEVSLLKAIHKKPN